VVSFFSFFLFPFSFVSVAFLRTFADISNETQKLCSENLMSFPKHLLVRYPSMHAFRFSLDAETHLSFRKERQGFFPEAIR
jgi:hypothetical protein